MPNRWAENQSLLARRFFLSFLTFAAACLLLGVAGSGLRSVNGSPDSEFSGVWLLAATSLLLSGSWVLENARRAAAAERQWLLRRQLLISIACAAGFVSLQTGLIMDWMARLPRQPEPVREIAGTVLLFVALHGLHFLVATGVLLWVTVSAFHDRYDHEYFFGVTVAGWLWHALGVVWLGLVFLFLTAM